MTTRRRIANNNAVVWLLGIVVLLMSFSLVAQVPTGTILGVVKDASRAIVAGATVAIRNIDTGDRRTVTSGPDGAYRVPQLWDRDED